MSRALSRTLTMIPHRQLDWVGTPKWCFRSDRAGLRVPLSTLHPRPYGHWHHSEAKLVRNILLARLLHPLLHADLARRLPRPLISIPTPISIISKTCTR
jgi:hypothetical protein